jgi:hypothetical protein
MGLMINQLNKLLERSKEQSIGSFHSEALYSTHPTVKLQNDIQLLKTKIKLKNTQFYSENVSPKSMKTDSLRREGEPMSVSELKNERDREGTVHDEQIRDSLFRIENLQNAFSRTIISVEEMIARLDDSNRQLNNQSKIIQDNARLKEDNLMAEVQLMRKQVILYLSFFDFH